MRNLRGKKTRTEQLKIYIQISKRRKDHEELNKLNKIVTEKLLEIIPRDHIIINESYSPHLTISKPEGMVKNSKIDDFWTKNEFL